MSYGYWLQSAQTSLEQTRRALRKGHPISASDVETTFAARTGVYHGLIRLTEMLIDLPQGRPIDQETASVALERAGASPVSLILGMRAASRAEGATPVANGRPVSPASRHLTDAAQNLAAAGDILASHAPSGSKPVTPEGAAIKAGAGGQAALGDIARLVHAQLLADDAFPSWVANGRTDRMHTYEPLLAAARWAVTSNLGAVARALVVEGNQHPPLLHGLTPAAPPLQSPQPIVHAHRAADRLTAICEWLYRNPEQIRIGHLNAGTQLGLTISLLATSPAIRRKSPAWTNAALAAKTLQGSPSESAAALSVDEMRRLKEWVDERVRLEGKPTSGARRAGFDRLAATLPLLAEVLRAGASTAVHRGDLFTSSAKHLVRAPGSLVWKAAGSWSIASPQSENVRDLIGALMRASAIASEDAPVRAPRAARRAFMPLSVATGGTTRQVPDNGQSPIRGPNRQR